MKIVQLYLALSLLPDFDRGFGFYAEGFDGVFIVSTKEEIAFSFPECDPFADGDVGVVRPHEDGNRLIVYLKVKLVAGRDLEGRHVFRDEVANKVTIDRNEDLGDAGAAPVCDLGGGSGGA